MSFPPDDFSQPNPFLVPPGDPFAASRGGTNPSSDVNPYLLPPGGPPAAYAGARTSAAAIVSLIMGLLSILLICACGISIVPAVLGIVFGHVARAKVRNSAGQLSGGGMALAGLILSYIGLLLLVGSWSLAFALRNEGRNGAPVVSSSTRSALDVAESKINTDTHGIAHGNTPRAEELARSFAEAMEEFDQEAFTETGRPGLLSGGHYVTYCELHDDSCAFVTHVPNYRKFEREAKDYLAEGAWQIAQAMVQEGLPPDAKLAVGLRGVLTYGAVMIGDVGEEDVDLDPEYQGVDRDRLEAFLDSQQPIEEPAIDLERPAVEAKEGGEHEFGIESDMEAEAEVESDIEFEDDVKVDPSTDAEGDSPPEESEEENPLESADEAGDVQPEESDDEENPFESEEAAGDTQPKESEADNPFE